MCLFFLCGQVPNGPRPCTDPWPGGWGLLFYGIILSTPAGAVTHPIPIPLDVQLEPCSSTSHPLYQQSRPRATFEYLSNFFFIFSLFSTKKNMASYYLINIAYYVIMFPIGDIRIKKNIPKIHFDNSQLITKIIKSKRPDQRYISENVRVN